MHARIIKTLPILPLTLIIVTGVFGQHKPSLQIKLDKDVLALPCRSAVTAKYRTCPDGMTINVSAIAKSVGKRKPDYSYSVSGGTTIGTGSDVIWDLSSAKPGTYLITVSTGDGASAQKSIIVEECPDCNAECLRCPHDVLKSSKDIVAPGDVVDITIDLPVGPKYIWRVVGGTIVDGEGTDRISLRIDQETDRTTVLISLDVQDNFCFEMFMCPPPKIELSIRKKK